MVLDSTHRNFSLDRGKQTLHDRRQDKRYPSTTSGTPPFRGPGYGLGRVARSLHRDQPALVYVGSIWRPRHVVLVVNADDESLSYYDPATGHTRTVARSRLLTLQGARVRPLFIVIPTGRRASS